MFTTHEGTQNRSTGDPVERAGPFFHTQARPTFRDVLGKLT
jgi:hypothetical protein